MNHETDTELDAHDARALRQLVNELRASAPPELDWERVETQIQGRTELESARRRRGSGGSFGSVGVFAVAAAAVVMLIANMSQRHVSSTVTPTAEVVDVRTLPTVSSDPDSLPQYNVGAVAPNSQIESGNEPVQLTLEGVATWTLEPHSKAIVRAAGKGPHVVELLEGSLFAEVVPRHSANEIVEAFVVEVGGARVAVHGTVFSVERRGDFVNVEVTRGTVTVGPSSYRGATTGRLLVSPAYASFDATSGAFVRDLPRKTYAAHESPTAKRVDEAAERHDRNTDDLSTPDDASHEDNPRDARRPGSLPTHEPFESPIPAASSASEVEPPVAPEPAVQAKLTVGAARGLVMGCLAQSKPAEGTGTVVTVGSQVTAVLGTDGAVNTVRFSPPLRPDLQSRCGGALFGRKLDGTGSVSFNVTFVMSK